MNVVAVSTRNIAEWYLEALRRIQRGEKATELLRANEVRLLKSYGLLRRKYRGRNGSWLVVTEKAEKIIEEAGDAG